MPAKGTSMRQLRVHLPNWLSLTRLALTPLLLVPALHGDRAGFLVLGLLLVLTDVLDGFLARAWRVSSPWGRVLDSIADFVFHVTFYCLALYLMWADARPYLGWMLLPGVWFALALPTGRLLTGRVRTLHLWGKKTLSHGYVVWLVYSMLVAFFVPGIVVLNLWAFIAFLEEIGIYLWLGRAVDEEITSIVHLVMPARTRHAGSGHVASEGEARPAFSRR